MLAGFSLSELLLKGAICIGGLHSALECGRLIL